MNYTGKQEYYNYLLWECFNNGMYFKRINELHIQQCETILSEPELFYNACLLVIEKYNFSARHHLTDNAINKRAYMGAAACNVLNGSTELEVRAAWSKLTEKKRDTANGIAEKVISLFHQQLTNKQNEQTVLEL